MSFLLRHANISSQRFTKVSTRCFHTVSHLNAGCISVGLIVLAQANRVRGQQGDHGGLATHWYIIIAAIGIFLSAVCCGWNVYRYVYRPQTSAKVIFSQVFVCKHGVSAQGCLCPGCLCPGGLCPGGLCPGKSLSRESLSRGSLSRGSLSRGSLSREVSVQGVSVQGGLCRRGLCPEGSLPGGVSVRGSL